MIYDFLRCYFAISTAIYHCILRWLLGGIPLFLLLLLLPHILF